MSTRLPAQVDAWRMVAARRSFSGTLPVVVLPRLVESVAAPAGDIEYELDFGCDELGHPSLDVQVCTQVTLLCQRSLEPFRTELRAKTRLSLIKDECDVEALPATSEPLLVSGPLRLEDVIEDELLLVLPLIPVAPGSEQKIAAWTGANRIEDAADAEPNPFAALSRLKSS